MRTSKRTWAGLCVAMLCLSACSKNNGNTSGTGGSSSSTGGMSSSTGGSSAGGSSAGTTGGGENTGEINTACQPDLLSNNPMTGDYAPHGACCHRASNISREKGLGPDDPMQLEYRLMYNITTNHPKTIGTSLPVMSTLSVYQLEAQNVLWRIKVPRMGGKEVMGAGEATFGYGAYMCDGTFSLFSDKAAPMGALSNDPTRWAGKVLPMTYDPSKTSPDDRFKFKWDDEMPRRQFINLPYVDTSNDAYPLDWELSFMGFHLLDFNPDGDAHDCVGKAGGGMNGWTAGGKFEVYTPVFGNNASKITALGVTYCTLVAFGVGAGGDCEHDTRCTPGMKDSSGKDCPWLKLPDSLCPKEAGEDKLFNCHLGAKGNINAEDGYPSDDALKCTATAPTTVRDPAQGAMDNGQCCDPLGMGKDGLPACNAYRLLQDFTAAAVEITDKPTDKLQQNCSKM